MIIDSRRTKTSVEVLTELDPSVLMLITNPEDEINGQSGGQNAEAEMKQAELMQLFQEMIKTPALKKKIMQSFSEHAMRKLFSHVLDNEFSAAGDWAGNQVNIEFNTENAAHVITKYTTNLIHIFIFAECFYQSLHSCFSFNSRLGNKPFQLVNTVF